MVRLSLAAVGLLVAFDLALAQPVFEDCSFPGIIVDVDPVEDIINVDSPLQITDVHVDMVLIHTFLGDVIMDLVSPNSVVVRLHDAAGGSTDDIILTYDDQGIPNGPPWDCLCNMQPSGPGVLADFAGLSDPGDWTLEVEDIFPTCGGGTLESWCLIIFDVVPPPPSPPIQDLDCDSITGSGVVALNWSNPVTYDAIEISLNGVTAEILPGDATSYMSPPQPIPSTVVAEVAGILGVESSTVECLQIVLPESPVEACFPSTTYLPPGPFEAVISVTEDVDVAEVEVLIDLTHPFINSLGLDVSAPSGTVVRLHDNDGSNEVRIYALYTTGGIPNDSPFECGCAMQPSGPGTLSDLAGGPSVGDWVLDMETPGSPTILLDEWCLRMFPVESFRRGDGDGDGSFSPVVDAIFVLAYQFIPGSPGPPCLDAADFNDDGVIALNDGIGILAYGFIPGALPPPPPGAVNCGNDPTSDLLTCEADCP